MQDERGLYYYPDPNSKKARVYVREENSTIQFRMWQQDHPEVWEKHDWIPMEIIENAARMYREMGRESNPMLLYDEAIARTLIKSAR
ncbi:MAG: hypothetical protein R3Y11_06450 [Pseudomonadota bacterium]